MASSDTLALNGGRGAIAPDAHRPWPEIGDEDRRFVAAVLDRGVTCGAFAPEITALQEEWAAYCGAAHCLGVNTGTAALHCCLAAVGVERGDEVIVPAFTFIATPHAVAHQGAVPVFCDVRLDSYNIDPSLIEERITDRTRALMPVHIHGQPADMDEIGAIAARHGLPVTEDAAQSHGATYKGRRTGTLADCAAFSLNATKNLSGGEGGLFVTDDERALDVARRLANYGENPAPLERGEFRSYLSSGLGWNYRGAELPAALARAQLRRLDRFNQTAQRNAAILTEGLGRIGGVVPPHVADDRTSVFHKYRIRLDPSALGFDGAATELRDRVLFALRAEGVEAVLWQVEPLPAHPAFRRTLQPWTERLEQEPLRDFDAAQYPVARRLVDESIVLGSEPAPLFVQTSELMDAYVEAVAKVVGNLDELLTLPYEPARLR
jgi:perosamine synthetase